VRVEHVMTESLHGISSGKSIEYAAEKMNELMVGSLIVYEEGKIVGIITSRDIRSAHPNRIVADSMTYNPISVSKDTFIGTALFIMEQNKVERLLVNDEEKIIGIVTRETLKSEINKNIDPLTNLFRSSYVEYLYESLVKENIIFHVIFIDLNDFGEINKKYSHTIGDDILKCFSSWLTESTDEKDFVSRYGGDEFVIISKRDQSGLDELIKRLSQPKIFCEIPISFEMGIMNGFQHDLSSIKYRDAIGQASLMSTALKNQNFYRS
jgi:GGDEF domain-containing protein